MEEKISKLEENLEIIQVKKDIELELKFLKGEETL